MSSKSNFQEGDFRKEFEDLEDKFQSQLERKEYEIAIKTLERIIELCSELDEFSIEKWIEYYEQLKDHIFNRTYDEKKQIMKMLFVNQEIITFTKFQFQMNLTFVDNFDTAIKSLPDSKYFRLVENRILFDKPPENDLDYVIEEFLSNLKMIIQ